MKRPPVFAALPGRPAPPASRRRAVVALAAGWLGLGGPLRSVAATPATPEAARKLAEAVFNRPAGRNVTTQVRMTLAEAGKAPRLRSLVTYRWAKAPGESVSLVRFLEPRDVEGTGLLSIARPDGSTEQSLYLPALDRVRKVAGDRKGGRFVGSDIYFEDLQERLPSKDRHRLLGTETIGGVACEMLESVPVDAADSVYRRRVSWIDPQTLLVHRVDYFERDETTPSKRFELLASRRIQGYWTETDTRISDLSTGHITRMTVEQALYDRKLPARLFSAQALADPAIEAEFRP